MISFLEKSTRYTCTPILLKDMCGGLGLRVPTTTTHNIGRYLYEKEREILAYTCNDRIWESHEVHLPNLDLFSQRFSCCCWQLWSRYEKNLESHQFIGLVQSNCFILQIIFESKGPLHGGKQCTRKDTLILLPDYFFSKLTLVVCMYYELKVKRFHRKRMPQLQAEFTYPLTRPYRNLNG